MKLASAAAAIAAISAAPFAGASSTCGDCQPSDGYLVTRLWNIMPGTTAQEVIDEFNSGFAMGAFHKILEILKPPTAFTK